MFVYSGVPFITFIALGICIADYIYMNKLSKTTNVLDAAMQCGALYRPYVTERKQYWRLVSAGFVHFSILHLLCNCYVLFSLGSSMEAAFGHLLYALLLFGSIITGNIFSVYMSEDYAITGGMSGGMYGLIAAELTMYLAVYGIEAVMKNGSVLSMILLNLLMNFFPNVNRKAHLGGTCMGILFITLLLRFLS